MQFSQPATTFQTPGRNGGKTSQIKFKFVWGIQKWGRREQKNSGGQMGGGEQVEDEENNRTINRDGRQEGRGKLVEDKENNRTIERWVTNSKRTASRALREQQNIRKVGCNSEEDSRYIYDEENCRTIQR